MYVLGCKLNVVRLCDSDIGITPVDEITTGITCTVFCFHIAHIIIIIIIIIIILVLFSILIKLTIMSCYFFFYFCLGCPCLCFAFSSVAFVTGNNAAKSECKHIKQLNITTLVLFLLS